MLRKYFVLSFINILTIFISLKFRAVAVQKDNININSALLPEDTSDLLFVSTLDGDLHALSRTTGVKKWILKSGGSEPVIRNINLSKDQPAVRFFPNPQDGSLYRYSVGHGRDPLKKLPFTIQELVANSPCRSNDGVFYVGKKVDKFVGIDPVTGTEQFHLEPEAMKHKCPKQSGNTIYLGRSLYNVVIYEIDTGQQWNVSFHHYNSNSEPCYDENSALVHYAAAGTGSLMTVDNSSGERLWFYDFPSPVVALYSICQGLLTSVPLTVVSPLTMNRYNDEKNDVCSDSIVSELRPVMYVGDSSTGVYALPALVDSNTPKISKLEEKLLLDGPSNQNALIKHVSNEDFVKDFLLLGYYAIPGDSKSKIIKTHAVESDNKDKIGEEIESDVNSDYAEVQSDEERELDFFPNGIFTKKPPQSKRKDPEPKLEETEDSVLFWVGIAEMKKMNVTFLTSMDVIVWVKLAVKFSAEWIFLTNFASLIFCSITVFLICLWVRYSISQFKAEVSSGSRPSRKRLSDGYSASPADEIGEGLMRVGKIQYDTQQLLGKGSEGTSVFKGSFEGRSVAVKRILPNSFSIADREVELLRASDLHPNVIRYYCMEQCREFRYIALELCLATLNDFVLKKTTVNVPSLALLKQATSGLSYLHSLDIVHRDIKPQNVLLSMPASNGEVRAMISDFGLCRQLENGRVSFSKRSGILGTEGWIAPEMVITSRPSVKVDVFSLGCVYYFVLTDGKHPFGSAFNRQSNIIAGKSSLNDLNNDTTDLYRRLVKKMISENPLDRPPITAVLKHPIFWSPEKVLQFFQDASERVDKIPTSSIVLRTLEKNSENVVRGDWVKYMHPVVESDLRRFRDYRGHSVRDLLRAIRNKKNHYRELGAELTAVFGNLPDEFVRYWTSRFPILLMHTWHALNTCKSEPVLHKYYPQEYTFNAGQKSPEGKTYENNTEISHFEEKTTDNILDFIESKLDANAGDLVKTKPRKGPKYPPKHDTNDTAPWVLKKRPKNLFEPQFIDIQSVNKIAKTTGNVDSTENQLRNNIGNTDEIPENVIDITPKNIASNTEENIRNKNFKNPEKTTKVNDKKFKNTVKSINKTDTNNVNSNKDSEKKADENTFDEFYNLKNIHTPPPGFKRSPPKAEPPDT